MSPKDKKEMMGKWGVSLDTEITPMLWDSVLNLRPKLRTLLSQERPTVLAFEFGMVDFFSLDVSVGSMVSTYGF